MKNQTLDLQTYQLEIINHVENEKMKKRNLLKGYLLFFAFELCIILPIALYYISAKG